VAVAVDFVVCAREPTSEVCVDVWVDPTKSLDMAEDKRGLGWGS
jgi:hypothetical protein